jgi:hypothetical protein
MALMALALVAASSASRSARARSAQCRSALSSEDSSRSGVDLALRSAARAGKSRLGQGGISGNPVEPKWSCWFVGCRTSSGLDTKKTTTKSDHTVDGGNLPPLYEIASSDSIIYSSISTDTKYY